MFTCIITLELSGLLTKLLPPVLIFAIEELIVEKNGSTDSWTGQEYIDFSYISVIS